MGIPSNYEKYLPTQYKMNYHSHAEYPMESGI